MNCDILKNNYQNHFRCKIVQKAFHLYRNSSIVLIVISSFNTLAKIISSSNALLSSFFLNIFKKLLPSTTILIRGLRL